MCQSEFYKHTSEHFGLGNGNMDPLSTYYYSLPIDYFSKSNISSSDKIIRSHWYQILTVILNWISTCTRTDLTPVVALLFAYNQKLSPEHLKVALYSLQYFHSTPYLSIKSYSSEAT